MRKSFFLGVIFLALSSWSYAKCEISYKVLYAVANIERHPKKEVGYPFIISFNKTSEMKILKTIPKSKYEILDNRSIDCKSLKNCVAIFYKLKHNEILNVDLGAFQINPKYHKYKAEEYFTLKNSLNIACSIITDIKNKYGWSWESLAKYHSYEKNNNLKYQKYLKRYAQD